LPGSDSWRRMISDCRHAETQETFLSSVRRYCRRVGAPDFFPELALLEWRIWKTGEHSLTVPHSLDEVTVNPSLYLLDLHWKNLVSCLDFRREDRPGIRR